MRDIRKDNIMDLRPASYMRHSLHYLSSSYTDY